MENPKSSFLDWNAFKNLFYEECAYMLRSPQKAEEPQKSIRHHLENVRLSENSAADRTQQMQMRIKKAFMFRVGNFCSQLSSIRGITTEPIYTVQSITLSPFERGIYLDFLLKTLQVTEQIMNRFFVETLSESHLFYEPLRRAYDAQTFLWWKIVPASQPAYQRREWVNTLKVYRADLPYLTFYYGTNALFPWQRRSQAKDLKKYMFCHMSTPFHAPAGCAACDANRMKLLDWYYRETYFGINLAAGLSDWLPTLECRKASSTTSSNSQQEIFCQDLLDRLMMIPYPTYRFTLIQTLLETFCGYQRRNEIIRQLWQMPLWEFVKQMGKLPPPDFPVPEDVRNLVLPNLLPEYAQSLLTIQNLSCFLDDAVYLSILSCMEVYRKPAILSPDTAVELLEDNTFWQQFQYVLCSLIYTEIQAFYTLDFSHPPEASLEHLPLILLSFDNPQAQHLMKSPLPRQDVRSMQYTSIQACCAHSRFPAPPI